MTESATFVYDDECGFCTWCAKRLIDHSELAVIGFSDIDDEQSERLPEDWREGAQLIKDEQV